MFCFLFDFRQDSSDLTWVSSLVANAIKIFSLVSNVMGGGDESAASSSSSSKPLKASNVNRVDSAAAAAAASQSDEVEEAMGTLMAFGGKYLRQMAMWAYEHATSTSSEPLGNSVAASSSSQLDDMETSGSSQSVVVVSTPTPISNKVGLPEKEEEPGRIKEQECYFFSLRAMCQIVAFLFQRAVFLNS